MGDPHDALTLSCHMFMHFSCICYLFFSDLLSTFCSHFLKKLRHGTQIAQIYSGSRLASWFWVIPLLILLFHLTSGFVMRRPRQTSLRTSRPMTFIWNVKSFCRISLILRYSMSFGFEEENLGERPLRCPVVFIQEFYSSIHDIDTSVPQFTTRFRGTRIVVTLDLVAEALRVPMVARLDYLGCDRLRTMSKDELISHFLWDSFHMGW